MIVLSAGSEAPDWGVIDKEIEHILQQVKSCPEDQEARSIVMRYFLSPRYVFQRMSSMGLTGPENGLERRAR